MDIHRLEIFCKVLEMQSFTKAAEAMLLSQPTVSEHIRALEETVGERLVDRLGREVLPTPAGKILYRYARDMIRLREEAIQALERFKGNLSGRLAFGASTIPGNYILPQLIGSFKRKYPSIQVTLKISSTAEVAEKLLEGSFELGLIGAKPKDRRLEPEEVFSDELILTVYPEHPWASGKEIELEELYGEPFIFRETGSGTRQTMVQILESHHFDLSRLFVVAEMGSTEAVRQSVKSRIGISILSSRSVSEDIRQGLLVNVPFKGTRFFRSFYLVYRKNRQLSPLGTAFLKHLRAEALREASEKTPEDFSH